MDVEETSIRRGEPGDEELLAKDFWHPLAKEMEKYHEVNKLKENADNMAVEGFHDRLTDDKFDFYFLSFGGEEVGYASLKNGKRETREKEDFVEITGLYIKEDYRSKGLGTKLLRKARKHAEERDADYLTVSAEWNNEKARRFYTKNDFREKKVKYVQLLSDN